MLHVLAHWAHDDDNIAKTPFYAGICDIVMFINEILSSHDYIDKFDFSFFASRYI